jgi:hypothetical protein
MTVRLITSIERFVGLDGETKPVDVPIGSVFLEADDAVEFIFVGDDYYATGTLEMADAGEATDEIDIAATNYVILASGANEAGEINVGGSAAATAANIVAAVNGTDGFNTANPDVTAALIGSDVALTAITPGADGNSITTVYTPVATSTNAFAGATLAGGQAAWQALP